jgi:hypothetical protein
MQLKIVCATLFVAACVLLCIGSGTLLLVPPYQGRYLTAGKVEYGVVPALGAIVVLTVVGWLWTRSGSALSLRKAVERSISWAIGACVLFYLIAAFIAARRQG